jgi:hypothetical protein
MKHALSVLALFAFVSSSLAAQAPPDSVMRASLLVQTRRSSDFAYSSPPTKVSVDSGRSHAMRNGAIAGALTGFTAGAIAGPFLYHTGCLTSDSSCSEVHTKIGFALFTGAEAAVSGAVVGAVTGKLLSLAHRGP